MINYQIIFKKLIIYITKKYNYPKIFLKKSIGGWGMGDWELGIGVWPQSPIPNPQSPIPNPH